MLQCLDDGRNDIFLHIDEKSEMQYEDFTGILRCSRLIPMPRRDVRWGGFSQIELEMDLISAAVRGGDYDFLHLISGVDMPLKPQDEIHAFFATHPNTEFVSIERDKTRAPGVRARYAYYHFLKDRYGKQKGALGRIDDFLVKVQKPFVRRDEGTVYGGGHNWFSITGAFAGYVAEHRDWISRRFRHTYCCDEIFLQTLLLNSPMAERLNRTEGTPSSLQCARLIDWERGKPYTFTIDDLNMLQNSSAIFARKFSMASEPTRRLVEALALRVCGDRERTAATGTEPTQ